MAGVAGAAVLVIAEVLRGSAGSIGRDSAVHAGRPIPWPTMLASGLAAALYAPLLAGVIMALPLISEFRDPEFAIVGAVLLGLIAGLFGLAVSFIAIGLAVGSALMVDRPNAWWFARAWGAGGVFFGWIVWRFFGELIADARVMGWAMLAVASVLLVVALPPRGERPPLPPRRRFVL